MPAAAVPRRKNAGPRLPMDTKSLEKKYSEFVASLPLHITEQGGDAINYKISEICAELNKILEFLDLQELAQRKEDSARTAHK